MIYFNLSLKKSPQHAAISTPPQLGQSRTFPLCSNTLTIRTVSSIEAIITYAVSIHCACPTVTAVVGTRGHHDGKVDLNRLLHGQPQRLPVVHIVH